MIEEVNIPEDRKGALIGRDGSAKDELESRSSTRITDCATRRHAGESRRVP